MKLVKTDFKDGEILGSVNYDIVKAALTGRNLNQLIKIYDLFLRFDPQISSEISTRKKRVSSFPILFQGGNEIQKDFCDRFFATKTFKNLVFNLSSALAYGFCVLIKNWYKNEKGEILPDFGYISPAFFNFDSEDGLFFRKNAEKIRVKEQKELFLYIHPSDSGDFISSALMYKIVSIAALKMAVINQNMNYFENLSVPPLIIKTDAADEKTGEEIIRQALSLRSNGVALFSKDDLIDLLGGSANQGQFLDFIKYCDECISKIVSGEVLSSNATEKGTQALGKVHDDIRKISNEFDALFLSSAVSEILRETLNLNFSDVEKFDFGFDTNTEKEEDLQSAVYERITKMGYEIPVEHMQNVFKIDGLKFKGETAANKSFISRNKADINMQNPKPIDKIDADVINADLSEIENEIKNNLNAILKECQSYEEAFEKLSGMYKNIHMEELEKVMFKVLENAEIIGAGDY